MTEDPEHPRDEPGRPSNPGDIGRRIVQRREQLGLSRAEAAERADMAVAYLQYVETSPAAVDRAALTRLAAVLGTTVEQLLGGGLDLPPGHGRAARHPVLEELPKSECWERLAHDGVGRVGLTTPTGPAVLPVNYWVLDGTVIFRTAYGTVLAGAVGQRVAFEVDHIDEVLRTGWSVLLVGAAQRIDDRPAVSHLKRAGTPDPWAGGDRDLWIRIKPDQVSGRVVRNAGPGSG